MAVIDADSYDVIKQHLDSAQFYSNMRNMRCCHCDEKISLQDEEHERWTGHYLGLVDPIYKLHLSVQVVSNGNGAVRSLGVIVMKKNAAAKFICKTCFEK
jgi:hypothetical protein